MRIVGRAENKRKRCTGSDHGPIRRGVEPPTPDIRSLHLAAVEMRDRRIELRRLQFLRDCERCGFGLLAAFAHLFRESPEGFRNVGNVNFFFDGWQSKPCLVSHSALRVRVRKTGRNLPISILHLRTWYARNFGMISRSQRKTEKSF